MRVSESFTQQTYLRNLREVKKALDEALNRQSSGKRILFASDDPDSAAELMRLTDESAQLTMRRNGLSQGRPWLQLTEQAISQLGSALSSALTYAVQGSSSTMQSAERIALAEQIAGIRKQVDGLTNLRISGRYIFSGTKTDTEPFDAANVYQGNAGTIEIPLDEGYVQINLSGQEIFGSAAAGPLKILADLENSLRLGTTQNTQAVLDGLRAAIADNSATLAKVGNYRSALEDADARFEDRLFQVKTRVNDLGAADMAEAISDVLQYTQSHEATLAAGARLYGPTFFDYIG